MEIIDFVYAQSGFRGVASIVDKVVFEGIKQFLTRGGTRELEWNEFRNVFNDSLYEPDNVALWFSQKLSEQEYLRYAQLLRVQSVMKKPSKFILLRTKDLGIDYISQLTVKKNVVTPYTVLPHTAKSELKVDEFLSMHYYQLWVKNTVSEKLANGSKRLVIHLPTGSGKTRTANELLSERINSGKPGSLIIWICHSVELCSQAESSLVRLLKYRLQRQVNIIPFYGNAKDISIDATMPNVMYTTYGKLSAYRKKFSVQDLSNRSTLVVVDEAHKVLAETYSDLVTDLVSLDSDLIGLTATPGRGNTDNHVMNKALSAYFYSNLVSYMEINAGNLFNILVKENYLAEIDHEVLSHSGSFNLDNEDLIKFNKTGFMSSEALGNLSSNFERNDEIIGRISQLIRQNAKRILVFASSTEHAKILLALMGYRKLKAKLVLGETPMQERQHIYKDFKEGELNIIVNFGVLTTGFDEPKLDVCLIARPCSSPVLYSQMVGRALRGEKNGGNKKNKIIDVSDNFIGMPELDQLFVRWNLNY